MTVLSVCKSLLVPVRQSQSIGTHPLRLAMPAVFACSSAFMLPASTAPNAMVFEKGHFTVVDMVITHTI